MDRRTLFLTLTCLMAAALPAHADEKKKGGGKGYTQFPMVTVFTSAGAAHHGTLSVDLGLYTDDAKLQAQIKIYMPRLQDAYLSRLQTYASVMDNHTLADTDYISTQLQQATDRVLGRSGAKVLLGSVLLN